MGNRQAAVDFYNKAVQALNDKGNPDHLSHSYSLFSAACMVDPTYGLAWYQCGNNNFDLKLHHAAVADWRRALQCPQASIANASAAGGQADSPATERAKILCNLGWGLYVVGQMNEAFEALDEAVKLDPTQAMIWMRLSLVHSILDHSQTSIDCALKAHKLEPDNSTIEMGLAFAYLLDGCYAQGFKHFESRFPYRLKNFLQYPYPKWLGEPGKIVHLVADQGIGDTLSFARFVEQVAKRCQYIHAAVQPCLMRLFTHAFMHLPNVNLLPQPCNLPQADSWSTFVSLPFALGLSDAQIKEAKHIVCPQISTFASTHPESWKVPDRTLHIGIAWAGSPLNDIDKHRNIPLQHFLELYDVPGVQLYSLQVGDKAREMRDAGAVALIGDLTPHISDVTDTLALLKHLDLVITCESALGHICALAGTETWVPYSFLGRDYRAGLTGQNKLWMPKHRYFRQGADLNWTPVFEEIKQALRERVNGTARQA